MRARSSKERMWHLKSPDNLYLQKSIPYQFVSSKNPNFSLKKLGMMLYLSNTPLNKEIL